MGSTHLECELQGAVAVRDLLHQLVPGVHHDGEQIQVLPPWLKCKGGASGAQERVGGREGGRERGSGRKGWMWGVGLAER